MDFPEYNGRDIVKAEYLLAVTGISMGADHTVQFAVSYPGFMDGIIPIAGGAFAGRQVLFYFMHLQSIIEPCDGWNNGNYGA